MALRNAFQFPRLNLRDQFLRLYRGLDEPPVRWLTGAGGFPDGGETGEGAAPTDPGNLGIAGRGDLAEALADPTSVVNIALDAMGLLGGPIGTLAVGVGRHAMAADNAGKLAAAITAVGKGESILGQIANQGLRFGVPPGAPPGLADPEGLTAEDVDVATEAEQGETGPSVGDPGDPGGLGEFRRGGPVRDRMTRPGGEEVIRAHEGEFVVRTGPAKKYRRLLEAINAGKPPLAGAAR